MTEWRLEYRGKLFPLRDGETTLGRSHYSSVVVNNSRASREHAVVKASGGKLEVVDLSSKNGTLVNGVPLTERRRVSEGDRIEIDIEVLVVRRREPADAGTFRIATEPGRPAVTPSTMAVEDATETIRRS